WRAAWGLCLAQLGLAQIDLNITCRYAGVFHVEKNGRYSISRTEAADLCKAFNSSLPTMAQMENARNHGFETCRYGFIEGHVVIPRIHPNSICAANNTGVYILTSNTSQYDTYCYNASAPAGEDCTSVTDLPNAFEGPITITIVNRDGTRYVKKGEYRTNPEDISPSTPTDDDGSSGASSERSTSGGYSVFHTHLPTAYPTSDQDGPWVSRHAESSPATSKSACLLTTPETPTGRPGAQDWFSWWFSPSEAKNDLHTTTQMAGTESKTASMGWEPDAENDDERDKHPSFSGSGIDDDEDFLSSTISATPWAPDYTEPHQDWSQWNPSRSYSEVLLPTATRSTDVDTGGTSTHGGHWTQEPQPPLTHHGHPSAEETQPPSSTTSWAHTSYPSQTAQTTVPGQTSPMDTDPGQRTVQQPTAGPSPGPVEEEDWTGPLSVTQQGHHSQSVSASHGGLEEDRDRAAPSTPTSGTSSDARGGRRGQSHPGGSATLLEGYTPHDPDSEENWTLSPGTLAETRAFGDSEVTASGGPTPSGDDAFSGDRAASDPSGDSHTTNGSESAGHSGGSRNGGASTTSGPARKPQIPEWLIILAALLALVLILAVCIAVNSRRRCGQKKKLVINSGNGAVEDRKPSGLNGEASKSQEMVHLVAKESSESPDQFTSADETRNLQNVDMKIGV
ncbi:CD44 antigen, partial [Carlito syrichta]|uniref:CD44 antigen n=1 Tax=Carlito syrichta TaxID=1868482 RepID=A0A3Q0EIE4_CARSF